jgi:gas vesicle protein
MLFKKETTSPVKTAAISAVVGGVLGAGVSALFAPKSGKQLRKDISQTAQDLSSEVSGLMGKKPRRMSVSKRTRSRRAK